SAAKGVRRHGVDPNRSRNEEVMPSLSPPAAKPPRPPPIQLVATATILGTISAVGTVGTVTRPPFFSDQHQPRGAGIWPENHDFRRWFVRMPPELPAQISPPFLHQIDRAPGARQDFKRRPLRDRSSSDHLGDSAEFSAEV
ncbi:hypothetical protein Prudu_017511, partial [Prunus dulcis]